MRWLSMLGLALWLGAGLAPALELEEIREQAPQFDFRYILSAYVVDVEGIEETTDSSFYVTGRAIQGTAGRKADSKLIITPPPTPIYDIFLAKVSPAGEIVSLHFYGGAGTEQVRFIRLGADGNVYLFGATTSTDFPAPGGQGGAFALQVDAASGDIVDFWRSEGEILQVLPGVDGGFLVAGETTSVDFQATIPGTPPGEFGVLVFAARVTANLELVYSRVLGGGGETRLGAASIDEFGRASLAGHTDSRDFLADAAIGPTGESDAFLLRLSPDGVLIDFATRLGGKGDEAVSALEETASGDWLLAGETKSTDFPAVSGAQTVLAGESDGFVARLSADGRELLASSLIGGAWSERVEHMATMDDGRIAIAGRTESSNFPVTEYGAGCTRAGSLRGLGFLATLDAGLTRVEGATRLGDSSAQGFVTGLRTSGQDVLVEVTNGSRQRLAGRDVVTKPPHELRFRADGTEAAVVGACVFNAASQIAGPAVPGGILTINGRGIGPQEFAIAEPKGGRFPFEINGVRVWFDDEPAALVHVQAYQVSIVAPASIAGKGSVSVVVERDGVRGQPFRISVREAHPGFLTQSLDGYRGALFNEDWSLNHWETPAPDRSVVAGFITGGGPLTPAVNPNGFAGFGELSRLAVPVTATIDGLPAEVEFAGQAPGKSNAIQQVNIRIPPEVRARTTSRSFGLVLDIGGVKTQSVQIWIE